MLRNASGRILKADPFLTTFALRRKASVACPNLVSLERVSRLFRWLCVQKMSPLLACFVISFHVNYVGFVKTRSYGEDAQSTR